MPAPVRLRNLFFDRVDSTHVRNKACQPVRRCWQLFWKPYGQGYSAGDSQGFFDSSPHTDIAESVPLLKGTAEVRRVERRTESVTIALESFTQVLYDWIFSEAKSGIQFRSDWQEILHNGQMHTQSGPSRR